MGEWVNKWKKYTAAVKTHIKHEMNDVIKSFGKVIFNISMETDKKKLFICCFMIELMRKQSKSKWKQQQTQKKLLFKQNAPEYLKIE